MESHLWNDKEGWYADYDLKTVKVRNQLTAAALFPLYVKAASQDRADKVAAAASSRLLKPGGISTTTINSGQQWDAPNGWAPLQWVAVEGLQNYGQQKVAMDVTRRFLKTFSIPTIARRNWLRSTMSLRPVPAVAAVSIRCRTVSAGVTA